MASQGLALLAATYSDSEGEESVVDEPTQALPVKPKTNYEYNKSASAQSSTSSSSTHWLASCVDDIIMSDEEIPSPTAEEFSSPTTVGDEMSFMSSDTETAVTSSCDPDDLEDGVTIPPEPAGKCSEELQATIAKYYNQMLNEGLDMNKFIQNTRSFRNPNLYERLVKYCDINESDTNYPPEIYDPLKWGKESYYDELSHVQEMEMARREKEKILKNSKLYFYPNAVKKPESDGNKMRSSRWDLTTPNVATKAYKKQPRLEQQLLTTNVNGAKRTVTYAFGSLPKKPKLLENKTLDK